MPDSSILAGPHRHLFDIPDDVAYFNTSYNGPQLRATTEALIAGAREKGQPWKRRAPDFFDDAERIRVLAAGLFGGTADNYAIVPATSYGMTAAARALETWVGSCDEILLIDEAFPSNVLPWQRLARETGASLVTVPTPGDLNWTDAVLSHIGPKTRVVAVPNCHWTNGARLDLTTISEAVRSFGAVLAVDASQSLGALPIDMGEVQPDFLVASGYKWLLCPYGFSLMYVSERWFGARPLEEAWLARENAEDFTGLVRYSQSYMPGARRFDVGEKCVPTLLPGAIKALEQLTLWGVPRIAATLERINLKVAEGLAELGLELPPADVRSPHMMGLKLPPGFDKPAVADLAKDQVYVSQRGQAIRLSPHLHVTDADIDRLLAAFRRLFG